MNVRRYDSRYALVLGTAMFLAAFALMAFAIPSTSGPTWVSRIALQQSTITATQTLTATEQMTATPTITPTTSMMTETPTAVPTSTPEPTPTPSGLSPETAREPNGSWSYIDGNSKIWFAMTDSRMKLEVWLDAHGHKGISMAVYAPDQKDLWFAKPVGRGTANSLKPEHDLFWAGRTAAFGKWYALVQNDNPFPVNFSINYERVATRVADRCAVCHGYDITFDSCEDKGDGFCGALEEEFGH